jgi:hypothetical protein
MTSTGQVQHSVATGRVKANFAWQHLKAASTLRDHVVQIESLNANQEFGLFFEDIRSYGSACILSVAASLEALINEFFIAPEGRLRREMNDFELEFWGGECHKGIERKPTLKKYQIALHKLGKPKFDKRKAPYRDAWALIQLRNALVHYKPIWDPDRKDKLVKVLAGRYELSPFADAGADFVTIRSMSADCMCWLISTAVRFMKEFHDRAQLDEQKMSAFWTFDQN